MKVVATALVGVLLLAACTAPQPMTPTASGPSGMISPSPVPTVLVTTPAAPLPTAGAVDYTGPKPMPAADGKPMLWPAGVAVKIDDDEGYRTEVTRYGFVNTSGRLVVHALYEGFEYCSDASGRATWLIATSPRRKAEVLDLTGKVVATASTKSASCGTPGTVIFSHWFDAELGHHRDGLLDIASGRVLVPMVPDRHIALVNATTLNVSEPAGEYFLNPRTGVRTPHVGWVFQDVRLEPGAPGLPAYKKRYANDYSNENGPMGFVGLNGKWVFPPTKAYPPSFDEGHAVVKLGEDRFTFLDARLQQVGGEWSGIQRVSVQVRTDDWRLVGYVVRSMSAQALLGTDLHAIVGPGAYRIVCEDDASGACSVSTPGVPSSLVVLPAGTVTAMPGGYTQALSPTFLADQEASNDFSASRLFVLGSGLSGQLDAPRSCHGVGPAFVECVQESANLPTPVVVDTHGQRTAFAGVEVAYQPVPSGGPAYYWVTTARYQGYVDSDGAWLYRQGRYTELED